MYTIKKYKNRKYYNTETSQYVNLNELEVLFKTIPDIRVILRPDDKDITGETMLAVIANKVENSTDIFALSNILRKGDGLLSNTCVYDDRESFDN